MDKDNQRQFSRNPADGSFRIRTASFPSGYKGSLKDISRSGAFVRSTIFPRLEEQITFEILDRHDRILSSCAGRVVRIQKGVKLREYGFAVHFDEPLQPVVEQALLSGR